MITNKDVQDDLHSRENRKGVAKGIVKLFDRWHIPPSDQSSLLGLSPKNRTTLARYRNGAPLANKKDLLNRAGHLLAIFVTLHQLFPYNTELADQWVTRPCETFEGRTPLELMKGNYEGLIAIRRYLMFELHR